MKTIGQGKELTTLLAKTEVLTGNYLHSSSVSLRQRQGFVNFDSYHTELCLPIIIVLSYVPPYIVLDGGDGCRTGGEGEGGAERKRDRLLMYRIKRAHWIVS